MESHTPQRVFRDCYKCFSATFNILPKIDDIFVASRTFSDRLQFLQNVFIKLRDANLKLNVAKCKFEEISVVYHGRIISADWIKPDPAKVVHLNQMKPPTSRKELEIFDGFVNYLSKFIPHYSDLLQPLCHVKKQRHFSWTLACDTAFQKIICAVNEATLLYYPDYTKEFFWIQTQVR